MGFQSPISYNTVIQIIFNNGEFIETNDLSEIASSIRSGKIKLAENNLEENNITQWIDDCFDISFYKKAKDLMGKK
jgi:hypothetical protein